MITCFQHLKNASLSKTDASQCGEMEMKGKLVLSVWVDASAAKPLLGYAGPHAR